MAVAYTTLAVAMGASDDFCTVTSATGITAGMWIKIDNEFARVAAVTGTRVDLKFRGTMGGSPAKAHDILAGVAFGLMSELPTPFPGQRPIPINPNRDLIYIGQDGAAPLPVRDTVYAIDKASAAAITIADPVGVPGGTIVIFASTVAAAHTVTLTTGVGGSNATDVYTFASGQKGVCLSLIAIAGVWLEVSRALLADDATAGVTVA